jgi:hypothetical protein
MLCIPAILGSIVGQIIDYRGCIIFLYIGQSQLLLSHHRRFHIIRWYRNSVLQVALLNNQRYQYAFRFRVNQIGYL